MRRKKWFTGVSMTVCLGLALAGCETAGGSAGAGALAGGALGAIIGHQSGHAGEGALIGAALGGLAGWGIHHARTRQLRNAQQTYQDYNYKSDDGFKLDMRGASVSPQTVAPGQTVTTKLEYATMGSGNGVNVEQRRVLKKDNEQLVELEREVINRTDGTWESELEFGVPKNATPGTYVVAHGLKAGDSAYERNMEFDVRSANAKSETGEERMVVTMTVSPWRQVEAW
jgi:hypothetical protein